MRAPLLVLALLASGCLGASLDPASTGAGLACPAPCARPVADEAGRAWEPHVAVDPRDPRHVVVGHAVWERTGPLATSWLVAHATFDAGASWTPTRLPGGPSAGPSHPLFGANAMGDAMLAFLPDGTLLYAGLAFLHAGAAAQADAGAYAREAYDLFVARSTDGGRSWGDVTVVRPGGGALALALAPAGAGRAGMYAGWDANDKEWLAVGRDGTVLLAWSRIVGIHPESPTSARHDVLASLSKDGGRSWSAPILVEKGGDLLGASPAITDDGAMHVAYVDLFTFDLRLATSTDGGATWHARSLGRSAWMPSLASRGDALALAYADPLEDAEHVIAQDAKRQAPTLMTSRDGGLTWTPPRRLAEPDAPGRVTPQVVYPPRGPPLVAYFQPDGGGASYRIEAVPEDAPAQRIVLDTPRAPPHALGDYQGLAATPDGALVAWVTSPDGRAFTPRVARVTLG